MHLAIEGEETKTESDGHSKLGKWSWKSKDASERLIDWWNGNVEIATTYNEKKKKLKSKETGHHWSWDNFSNLMYM